MTTNKQLTIRKNYLNPTVWGQMKVMSETFIQSRALPAYIQNAAQAMMVLQAGYEMGMKPMESFKSLYMVNGQINIHGAATMRRLREHGWDIKPYQMTTDKGGTCTVTVVHRETKAEYSESFSFENAEKSGYTLDNYGKLKVGWKLGANREMKLRYNAVSKLIKSYLPEVMGSASDIAEVAEDYTIDQNTTEAATESQSPNKIVAPASERPDLKTFINNAKIKKEEKVNAPATRAQEIKEKEKILTEQVKKEAGK